MPTRKQLFKIWEAQFEFFGGTGQPKENYVGRHESHGMTSDKYVDTPVVSRNNFTEFSGKDVGFIRVNPETKDLEIVYDPQPDTR